jgi:hypothetical protein
MCLLVQRISSIDTGTRSIYNSYVNLQGCLGVGGTPKVKLLVYSYLLHSQT